MAPKNDLENDRAVLMVEFNMRLEEQFHIQIPDVVADAFLTVADATKYVEARVGKN